MADTTIARQGTSEVSAPSKPNIFRTIQSLLVGGIFPGSIAPTILSAYNELERMAKDLEGAVVAGVEAAVSKKVEQEVSKVTGVESAAGAISPEVVQAATNAAVTAELNNLNVSS